MSAVYATLRSQASNITFAAISGGALTGSGTLYLTAQLRSRSGLNLPQTPVSLSYTAGQRVSVTIGAAALAAAEAGSAHEVVISGAATNSLSAMVRLASFSLLQADQLTQVSLPQTFYLSQPAHIALAAVVANSAALPTGSSLMQGMVRQITSLSANYYKYDSAATAGDIAASTGYWSLFYPWIGAGNGFTTYIGTSTDNPGGCDYPLQSVGSDALPLPAYNPAAGASTPLRVAIENGLTEDGGNSIAALSQIGMTVLANGVDLSAAFSGAIDVTYLGLARKSDGSLDTSNANVGVGQTVTLYAGIANAQQNAQGNATLSSYATTNLTFPQAVPRGYFALFTVRFNSRANTIAQLFNGENVTLYMSDIGSVGKYSPMAVIFSGNTAGGTVIQYPGLASVGVTDGYLRILPGVNSVVRQLGFGCFQGFEAGPLAGTAAATLSIADTAGQKVTIAGTNNGQIIVRQPSDTLLPTEALRAKVSTLPGTADAIATGAAFSNAVSVGAAGTLNLTLTYPTTIRANYPDVIAGTIAPYNVPRLKVYLKLSGVITEQSALVTVTPGGTQNIVVSTNTGSTVSTLPTNADPAFCLFNAPSATGSAGTGGSLAAGSYQYAVVPHFPASNTQATAISHKVSDGCVPEILTDLATAIGGAKGYTTVSSPGFVQPAIGGSVVIPVPLTDLFGVGAPLFVQSSGNYKITSKTSTLLTATRQGDDGSYAAVGSTIVASSLVAPGGATGATGAAGAIAGLRYTFSSTTTATPTTGTIRLNNATPASVTALYVSKTDRNSNLVTAVLAAINAGSVLLLQDEATPTNYAYFSFTSATVNTNDESFVVTYLSGSGTFANGANVSLGFALTGQQGTAATIAVGTTSTLSAGSSATVSNAGTSSAAVLNFGIPTGSPGAAATIAVGTVTTGASGSSATVSNAGTSGAAVLNFGIPTGSPGAAATIAVGTVTTGASGSSATVSNAGTSSAAVFNFSIPKGADGSGAGTVTSFSAGNLSPLFTTSVATATATPALSFALSNAAQNVILAGPSSGGSGVPSYRSLVKADFPAVTAFLDAQQTYTKSQGAQTQALTSSGTVAIDASLSNVFRITLGSGNTIANPTNLVDGFTYLFTLVQDGTGSRTVTWGSNYDFGAAGTATLTTTASKKDILSFLSDGTKLYFCGIQKGFS